MEKWKAALFSYPSKMKDYLFYKKSFASFPLDNSMDFHGAMVSLVAPIRLMIVMETLLTCTVVETTKFITK